MQYFNQTLNWAKFFIQTNNSSHRIWIFGENGDFIKTFTCNSQGFLELKTYFGQNGNQLNLKFDQKNNLENSDAQKRIKICNQNEKIEQNWIIIYEYPWQFGQRMWYCPRLWCNFEDKLETDKNENLDENQLENEKESRKIEKYLTKILTKIQIISQKKQITFLKFELDLETDLENSKPKIGQNKQNLIENLKKNKKNINQLEQKKETKSQEMENWKNLWTKLAKNENLEIINSDKKLQYLSTIILDLGELKIEQNQIGKLEKENNKTNVKNINQLEQKKEDISKNNLQISNGETKNFWSQNEKIWAKLLDKRTRYGTRKSLDFWQIDCQKTEANFEHFYNLCEETATRQHFAIHPKKYLKKLFDQEFTRIILLKNEQNQICSCWLGIICGQSLVNLYGGNNEFSRANYGQYFLHLTAILITKRENCKFYDLGGLEEEKGFNLFKKGYLGKEKKFIGAFDLIFKPFNYQITNSLIKLGKKIRNLRIKK